MSWSDLLLFLHISAAVIWIGGGLMMQFFGLRASMSGDPRRLGELGTDIDWIANRVFIPASLGAFVTGVLLVIEIPGLGFGDDWIVIGLLLYATTFLAGILFLGPESARIGKLMAEGSPEAGPRTMRLILLGRLDLVLLFFILYDMAVKPEFFSRALLEGLAAAALAAGLIYWRYKVALSQPPPGPPPPPAEPAAD
jgi:uncharacterized membrane protein